MNKTLKDHYKEFLKAYDEVNKLSVRSLLETELIRGNYREIIFELDENKKRIFIQSDGLRLSSLGITSLAKLHAYSDKLIYLGRLIVFNEMLRRLLESQNLCKLYKDLVETNL